MTAAAVARTLPTAAVAYACSISRSSEIPDSSGARATSSAIQRGPAACAFTLAASTSATTAAIPDVVVSEMDGLAFAGGSLSSTGMSDCSAAITSSSAAGATVSATARAASTGASGVTVSFASAIAGSGSVSSGDGEEETDGSIWTSSAGPVEDAAGPV